MHVPESQSQTIHATEPDAFSMCYGFCQESSEYVAQLLGTDLRSQTPSSQGLINHTLLSEKDHSKQMFSSPDLSIQVPQKDVSSYCNYQQHHQYCASMSCSGELTQQSKSKQIQYFSGREEDERKK